MRRAFLATVAVGLCVSACFGRAALEAYQIGSGEGGAGGVATSTGTTTPTTTTPTDTPPTTTWTTTTWTTTTPTGPSDCDGTGDCDICVECTIADLCQAQVQACYAFGPCVQFMECVQDCPDLDQSCVAPCVDANPEGGKVYFDAIDCIVCLGCPSDCVEYTSLCFQEG